MRSGGGRFWGGWRREVLGRGGALPEVVVDLADDGVRGGHDVGRPRPGGRPALPHDLQGRVEQAADLARVAGLPLGQGPLRDPFRNIILDIKN